jgi:uncharacterized protein YbaR (Trm112 family)
MTKNCNLKIVVTCPECKQNRLARTDVIKKIKKSGKKLICKPCNNKLRFVNKPHPKKGTGVINNPELLRTRNSFYKAKQRCKLGAKHHKCYENVEFKFEKLNDLIECIGIRPVGKTLDRINPLGHYEKGNVRWATMKEQNQNRLPKNYWK